MMNGSSTWERTALRNGNVGVSLVNENTIEILDFSKDSDVLESVIKLWRRYSDTLGFFPEGAFKDYAVKKQIIVLLDQKREVLGYVLYRVSKLRVSITHLCIDTSSRGSGHSRVLLDKLKEETYELKGIGLYCRRDYTVSLLWPKLGFVPITEKEGRGKDKKILTFWWLDYRNPDLLSPLAVNGVTEKIDIVVDANIFFDLDEKNKKPEGLESKALSADWFKGEVSMSVTNEIYTEINRCECGKERDRQRKRTSFFNAIEADPNKVNSLEKELSTILRSPRNEQDKSDYRQLAHAISSGANYFITRDDYVLNSNDIIYEKYGLNINRPAEIILEADSLYDEVSYKPARLAGTLASLALVSGNDIKNIIEKFCLTKLGEKKNKLEKRLASMVSQPDKVRVYVAKDKNKNILSAFSVSKEAQGVLRVSFARVGGGRLNSTLARYILIKLIRDSNTNQVCSIRFSDEYIQPIFYDAFREQGFLKDGKEHVRLIINYPINIFSLEESINNKKFKALNNVGEDFNSQISTVIKNSEEGKEKYSTNELERLIWPGKIIENDMPCYIVPIKLGWARGLFDEGLASQDLFGADLDLAIQNEGVYYYSVRGAKTHAPARILWYVSQDKKIPNSSSIRACSVLNEVTIDTPKPLFKKYRRLGVYNWSDVLQTANNDIEKSLVAINFSQTELFRSPIEWQTMQEIISDLNVNKSIISATPIPASIFMKLYKLGIN